MEKASNQVTKQGACLSGRDSGGGGGGGGDDDDDECRVLDAGNDV